MDDNIINQIIFAIFLVGMIIVAVLVIIHYSKSTPAKFDCTTLKIVEINYTDFKNKGVGIFYTLELNGKMVEYSLNKERIEMYKGLFEHYLCKGEQNGISYDKGR